MNPIDRIYTEKYRPKKVSEMVGDFKEKILKYLENPSSIPNFLLHSKTPGTGKSTLMKAIANELGCDYLLINSSDDRTIDTIREKIKEFAMSKSSNGIRKAVLLDEADGMLKASQDALRNIMETYSSNVFFVLTCNALNKIIEPIKSRCVLIAFAYPEKKEIEKYIEMICEKENIDYTEEGIRRLVDVNYPSIRNAVIALQDLKTEGKACIADNVKPVNELYQQLWESLVKKDWQTVKRAVLESTVDPRDLNIFFWQQALEVADVKMIQLTCRNERDISFGSDAKVIVVSSLFEMVK